MASRQAAWTLERLHRLPDDGKKHEIIRGELLVTPAPAVPHEMLLTLLTKALVPYVDRWNLGAVFHPRAVIRHKDSEVEPDLMVRPLFSPKETDWAKLPLPHLVVEVPSSTTRLRDYNRKRDFYMELGIPEYWIVDGVQREITVVRPESSSVVATDRLQWHPSGAEDPLDLDVQNLFLDAIGPD